MIHGHIARKCQRQDLNTDLFGFRASPVPVSCFLALGAYIPSDGCHVTSYISECML